MSVFPPKTREIQPGTRVTVKGAPEEWEGYFTGGFYQTSMVGKLQLQIFWVTRDDLSPHDAFRKQVFNIGGSGSEGFLDKKGRQPRPQDVCRCTSEDADTVVVWRSTKRVRYAIRRVVYRIRRVVYLLTPKI